MSTLPGLELLRDSLRNTVVEKWAAKIATVNAARTVDIRASVAGPYVVTSGMSLTIAVDGTPGTITPNTGSRTAAQMVTDFDAAIATLGCADDSGRFVLRHGSTPDPDATAPTQKDKKIEIVSDSGGLAALMGFSIGDAEHRAPLLPLPRDHFYDYIPHAYDKQPYVVIEDLAMDGPIYLRPKQLIWAPVKLTIGAAYLGGSYRPTLDLILGYARAFREIVDENRALGTTGDSQEIITVRVEKMQAQPRLYRASESSPVFAEASIDLRVRMWNG